MEIVLIIMLWEISLVISFAAGSKFCSKRRQSVTRPEHSEQDLLELRRTQRELENFMSYDGREQEVINEE